MLNYLTEYVLSKMFKQHTLSLLSRRCSSHREWETNGCGAISF